MTQNNLATAYNDRIRGDRAENIEQAIEHYEPGPVGFHARRIPQLLPRNGLQAGQSFPGRPSLL